MCNNKKFILGIALFLLSLPCFGSIAYVSASHTANTQTVSTTATQTTTLTASTTAGNDVVVGLAWKTTTQTLSSVVGSNAAAFFRLYGQQCNGTSECSALLVCRKCKSLTTVTPTFSGGTVFSTIVEEYSGVQSIGIPTAATATSTNPGVTITTSDANDWVVCATASLGNDGIPTAGTGSAGTLRDANRTGTTSSNVAGAVVDNSSVSPGSVGCKDTITSSAWAATGIELRTAAPPTANVYPNCSAGVPCVIFHRQIGTFGTTEANNGFEFFLPPQAIGQLLIIGVTYTDTLTVSSLTTENSDTFTSRVSQDDVTSGEKSEIYTGTPTAGSTKITLTFSAAAASGNAVEITMTSLANAGAVDGTASTQGITASPYQAGSFTPTTNGDFIYNYLITSYPFPESENPIPPTVTPQDGWSLLDTQTLDKIADQYIIQATAAAINPTMYLLDLNARRYNSLAIAIKAAAGSLPTGIQVVKEHHFYHVTSGAQAEQFPTSGNVFVFPTSGGSTNGTISSVADSVGNTYTQATPTGFDSVNDPQVYYATNATPANDLIYTWSQVNSAPRFVLFDIAGVDTVSPLCTSEEAHGTQSEVDSITNFSITSNVATFTATNTLTAGESVTISGLTTGTYFIGQTLTVLATGLSGTQFEANFTHANVASTADSGFASTDITGAGTITPACSANSLIVNVNGDGTGPPTQLFNPPGATMASIWAVGMSDTSEWSSGDGWAYYKNVSGAGSRSFDWHMANPNISTHFAIDLAFNPPSSGGSTPTCTISLMGAGPC